MNANAIKPEGKTSASTSLVQPRAFTLTWALNARSIGNVFVSVITMSAMQTTLRIADSLAMTSLNFVVDAP